jgi:type VI secretion system protein VasG
MICAIIRLQLGRIKKRVEESHKVPFTFDDGVVRLIASRCTEFLSRMMAGKTIEYRESICQPS